MLGTRISCAPSYSKLATIPNPLLIARLTTSRGVRSSVEGVRKSLPPPHTTKSPLAKYGLRSACVAASYPCIPGSEIKPEVVGVPPSA